MARIAVPVLVSMVLAGGLARAGGNATLALRAQQAARTEVKVERAITCGRIVRGNPARKEIALTFDDGPHGPLTEALLDILRRENVSATFFVVGRMVDLYPDLVRREAAEGHEIGNHTYDHLRLPGLPRNVVESELREGAAAITRAIGAPVRLYRPPGGEYDAAVIDAAKRMDNVMVLWTDDPGDFARPGGALIESRVLSGVEPGAIVLLHDGVQQTLDVLPDMIHKLKAQGYHFVTVSEMAREHGAITDGGPCIKARKAAAL